MNLAPPINPNYAAVVVEVKALRELENCDNVVGLPLFGLQAIVGKDTKVGDVGLFFPAETQLSEEFARANNLHRHGDRNADPRVAGYFEDNRRVKAMKFRGHQSDAFFIPLSSLGYLWKAGATKDALEKLLPVGSIFDALDGHEICKKYLVKEPGVNRGPTAKVKRVDLKVFPTHVDSENYWRNSHKIPNDAQVIVTQKLHGTSGRWGNVPVTQELNWRERLAKKLGINVADKKHQIVAGSRMVVKSIDGTLEEGKQNFYLDDLWTRWAKKIGDSIPENFIVYGELIGWTADGTAIQKNYTYNLPVGESELYVYRVAVVTEQGRTVDLSWEQVKEFCFETQLKHVPELWAGHHTAWGEADNWMDIRYAEQNPRNIHGARVPYNETPVPLSDTKTVDEGVCVRYDGPQGIYILKAKSPIFLGHESKLLDEEIVDMESEES